MMGDGAAWPGDNRSPDQVFCQSGRALIQLADREVDARAHAEDLRSQTAKSPSSWTSPKPSCPGWRSPTRPRWPAVPVVQRGERAETPSRHAPATQAPDRTRNPDRDRTRVVHHGMRRGPVDPARAPGISQRAKTILDCPARGEFGANPVQQRPGLRVERLTLVRRPRTGCRWIVPVQR